MKDIPGEGRAVGNLGNAYSALGKFAEATKYHSRRLAIAVQTNDQVGMVLWSGSCQGPMHAVRGQPTGRYLRLSWVRQEVVFFPAPHAVMGLPLLCLGGKGTCLW